MAIERIEAGVDWIQMTLPHDSPHALDIAEVYTFSSKKEEELGNLSHDVSFLGFEGFATGHVTLARHNKTKRLLFKCSGAPTDTYLADIIPVALANSTTVTRLDVRSDVWYNDYNGDLAQAISDRIKKMGTAAKAGRPLLEDGFGAGDTLYFGAPSSDRRLRMYDKYREQHNDPYWRNCWRYEVQYRQLYAKNALKHVADAGAYNEAAATIVNSEYAQHGIIPVPDVRVVQRPGAIARDNDIDRRARWLQNQVGPAVRDLAIARGWDYVISLLKGG